MNTALTLAGLSILALATLGWLVALAPRVAGRVRLLTLLTITLFGLGTAVLGFGVGGVGTPFPAWQQVTQAGKGVFYGVGLFCMLALYLSPRSISWRAWGGLVAYGVALLLAGSMATVPGLTDVLPYLLLAILGAVTVAYTDRGQLVRAIRGVLVALCAGSLMYWAVLPAWATSNPDLSYGDAAATYESTIGLAVRLHGLSGHGNGLGYIAAAAVLLGLHPVARFRWEWVWQGAAFACLIASQSKTMWAAVAVGWGVWAFFQIGRLRGIRRAVAQAGLMSMIGVGVAALTVYAPLLDSADRTLTGRTNVWNITLQEFRDNPLSGYGPTLWDENYRNALSLPWVGHAHNQIIQVLGQAGLIGLVGLIVASLAVLGAAWRSRKVTRGASLALVVLLIARGMTESPLRFGADAGALVVMAVYLVATTTSDSHTLRSPRVPE